MIQGGKCVRKIAIEAKVNKGTFPKKFETGTIYSPG
jgi:hypothetical protein